MNAFGVRITSLLAVLAFTSVGPMQAQDNVTQSAPDSTDQQFLSYAAEDNQAEIQLCLIAEKRAANPALKAFARLMVDDHAEVESRLAALADQLHFRLPDSIGEDGKRTLSELSALYDNEFELKFMQAQIGDHSEDIKKYAEEEAKTKNTRIRQFATETAPILQQHLALARAVNAQVGNHAIGSTTK